MHDFIAELRHFKRLFVLTGAGISLSSGIPTYRDAQGRWTASQPIQHGDFIAHASTRQRYWARSIVGWRSFGQAEPNAAHRALAAAEREGYLQLLVTQNVDRLHQRAGSENAVDLHGRLDQVICLHCGDTTLRAEHQHRLEALNPDFQLAADTLRPDGDADVPDALIASMQVVGCVVCGGVLKPNVVFFGDNVPRERVQTCQDALQAADAMLVVGSSLQVYSGLRFCRQAAQQSTPIFSINPGETRADHLIDHRCRAPAAEVLAAWVSALGSDVDERPSEHQGNADKSDQM